MEREQLSEWLSAYLDDELDEHQTQSAERLLREDEAARRLLEELRRTVDIVSSLPRHVAPSSIADDLQSRLERGELLDGLEEPRSIPAGRRSSMAAWLSIAAMVGLAVVGGLWIITDRPGSGPGMGRFAEPGRPEASDVASPATTAGRTRSKRRPAKRPTTPTSPPGEVLTSAGPTTGPAEAVDLTPSGASLLATADVARKLTAGVELDSLRAHPFANEPVRLQVAVRSKAERDALMTRLVSRLANRDLADLADERITDRGRSEPAGGFYYRGQPKVNFEDLSDRQMLVRIPTRELDGLMDELVHTPGAKEDVALVAGSLVFRGLDNARETLRRLEEPGRVAAVRRSKLRSYRLDELLKAIGLDPGLVAKVTKPSPGAAKRPSGLPPTESVRDEDTGEDEDQAASAEPASLVERRLRALEARRGDRPEYSAAVMRDASDAASGGAKAAASPLDGTVVAQEASRRFVTLVVEVRIAKLPPETKPSAKPAPKPPYEEAKRGPTPLPRKPQTSPRAE